MGKGVFWREFHEGEVVVTPERSVEVSLTVAPECIMTEARTAPAVVRAQAEDERRRPTQSRHFETLAVTEAAVGSTRLLCYKHSHAGPSQTDLLKRTLQGGG